MGELRAWGGVRLAALRRCGHRLYNYSFWYALRRRDAAGGHLYMPALRAWDGRVWGRVRRLGMWEEGLADDDALSDLEEFGFAEAVEFADVGDGGAIFGGKSTEGVATSYDVNLTF